MQPNRTSYVQSLANELVAQAKRVRDLIGDAQWLADGHHKEYLLRALLDRHMPSGFMVSRGFVLGAGAPSLVSREQDVLVLDSMIEAPCFDQGGLCVAFPGTVAAAISVKTSLENKTVQDSVETLNSLGDLLAQHHHAVGAWLGAFFFQSNVKPEKAIDYVADALLRSPGAISKFALAGGPSRVLPIAFTTADDLFVRVEGPDVDTGTFVVRGFALERCATAAFLGQLLDGLAQRRGGVAMFGSVLDGATCRPLSHTREIRFPA